MLLVVQFVKYLCEMHVIQVSENMYVIQKAVILHNYFFIHYFFYDFFKSIEQRSQILLLMYLGYKPKKR